MDVPVSVGEVVDKITILTIKEQRIADPAKRANVRRELEALRRTWTASGKPWPEAEARALEVVNGSLWDVEDALRRDEAQGDFGDGFVARARSVYRINDQRAAIKRQINLAAGSELVEEKDYVVY